MTTPNEDAIGEMRAMQERIRQIRDRHCEPKSNENPRYLGLSSAVAGLTKAISDMEAESGSWAQGCAELHAAGWARR